MKHLEKLLKEMAKDTIKKCKHLWIKDKQGKYCKKCGKRIYNFNKEG